VLDRTHGIGFGAVPQVAASASGEAVAAWLRRSRTVVPYRVRTALLGPRASSWAAPADVSPADVDATIPRLAMGSDGGAVAVWSCRCTPPPPGGTATSVQSAARPPGGGFGPATPLGAAVPPFLELSAAAGPGGAAVAAWGAGPPDPGLIAADRRPDGTWSAPAKISQAPAGILGFASNVNVAMNAHGEALVVWQGPDGLLSSGRAAAGPWSAPTPIPTPSGASGRAALGMDDAGNAILVLRAPHQASLNFRVVAFTRAAGAAAWSGPVALSPAGPTTGAPAPSAGQPALSVNGHGQAVVVWAQTVSGVPRVLARRRTASTGPWGPLEAVSAPAREPTSPRVAMDAGGHAVAVWLERTAPRLKGGRTRTVVRAAGTT
jgi:hypothetical protein